MGLLDIFNTPSDNTPTVSSILPSIAKQQIMQGQLPIINTDQVFLKAGTTPRFQESIVIMLIAPYMRKKPFGSVMFEKILDIVSPVCLEELG